MKVPSTWLCGEKHFTGDRTAGCPVAKEEQRAVSVGWSRLHAAVDVKPARKPPGKWQELSW